MSLRSILAAALAVILGASFVFAQDQPAIWRQYAEKVGPNELVAVRLSNGSTFQGHIIQVTDDRLIVLPKTRIRVPARTIALADVESIEARKEGMSPGAKVLIGAGSVAGVMMVITLALLAGSY